MKSLSIDIQNQWKLEAEFRKNHSGMGSGVECEVGWEVEFSGKWSGVESGRPEIGNPKV